MYYLNEKGMRQLIYMALGVLCVAGVLSAALGYVLLEFPSWLVIGTGTVMMLLSAFCACTILFSIVSGLFCMKRVSTK